MPTYFFDLQTSSGKILDSEGAEFRDVSAAERHARVVAQELMLHREVATRNWRIDIRDTCGLRAANVLFASVDASLGHLAPHLRSSLEQLCGTSASFFETVGATRQTLHQIQATLARAERAPYLAAINGCAIVD